MVESANSFYVISVVNIEVHHGETQPMSIEFSFIENRSYVLATITETVITVEGAKSILKSISDEGKKHKCSRVLLNELAVEKREIASHELRDISNCISGIRIGFLCKAELMDKNSRLLAAITFGEGYTVKHFSVEEEAIEWLTSPSFSRKRPTR